MFRDRTHAGRILASLLASYAGRSDLIVLGVSPGGVIVGDAIAEALGAPLDAFLVRTAAVPVFGRATVAIVAPDGGVVVDEASVSRLGVPRELVDSAAVEAARMLLQDTRRLRGDRPPPELRGRTAVLVDDGLVGGSPLWPAAAVAARRGARAVAAAVPVADRALAETLAADVDDLIYAATPEPMIAVGLWYDEFRAVPDREVRAALERREAAIAALQEDGR